jgi:dipeptidyl aminopeptidase/acylaminoacyl peptidase
MPPSPMTSAAHTLLLAAALAAASALTATPAQSQLPAAAQAGKPPVAAGDYGRWERGSSPSLAPDGSWLALVVTRVDEERELRVRAVAGGDTALVFKHASAPVFSPDARWLAYVVGVSAAERERLDAARKPVRNGVGLLDLQSGATLLVPDVAWFRFSGDGRHIAMRTYPPQDDKLGIADVLVRDLAAGTLMTLGSVTGQSWSDTGALLAYTVRTASGNAVQLFDAGTGRLRSLDDAPTAVYSSLAWRRDADDLAVLRAEPVDSMYRDTAHAILAWTGLTRRVPEPRVLDAASLAPFGGVAGIAGQRPLSWARGGGTVYFGVRPRDAVTPRDTAAAGTSKLSDVQVWHAGDVRIFPMQRAQEQQDLRRTLLGAWAVSTGRVVPVGTDLLAATQVLPGDRYATETTDRPYPAGTMFGRPYSDVYIIDLRTGERRLAIERVRHVYGASPAGSYLLYYRGGDFWSYDISGNRHTNLTHGLGAVFADEEYDTPTDEVPPYWAPPRWLRGERHVLLHDRYDVWRVAADGSGGTRLTAGASERVVHRVQPVRSTEDGIDERQPLYLSLHGERTKQSGFARLRALRAGAQVERLVLEDGMHAALIRADSADVFAWSVQRFDAPPVWHAAGADLARPRQLFALNPFHDEFAWGRAELIDFTSDAGVPLQGALFYPANYDPTRRYPMIVYTYEIMSPQIHSFDVPSDRSAYNRAVWTAEGYFVLLPDIVYRARDPGVSAVEAVVPAVRGVVDRGLVDAARVGLIGHSWGGYQAAYIPTRTDIFAAAVAGAPLTNFISFAGQIHWRPGMPEFDHWETGQGRMEVPPWEDLEAHLRNSPINFIAELNTPMLMMFGDEDGTVDWHQGIEFYNYARRAGKEFVMLVYPGEDHGLRKKENQTDYSRRILQWFGHYLKGEPPAAWMTDGVPFLERKRQLDSAPAGRD